MLPRLLVNLKAYPESSGTRAIEISKLAERVWRETGVLIGVAPNFLDLRAVSSSVEIPVFAQHVDPLPPGPFTGHVPPALVKEAGASGSLLNHSERQLSLRHIAEAISIMRELGLLSIVCSSTPSESAVIAALSPNAIAVEPPELIGSGIPVSKAKPEVILNSLKAVRSVNKEVPLLCGAGISSGDDVRAALELGSYGVLVASAITKSPDPYRKIRELAEPASSFAPEPTF
ncbi:MAG: triose-phosphate isomerase [Candidatus Korarchaeum sp.]